MQGEEDEDLISRAEIARRLRVNPARAGQLMSHHPNFPPPVRTRPYRLYRPSDIAEFDRNWDRKEGSPGLGRSHYLDVAQAYRAYVRYREPPIKSLATKYKVNYTVARYWVRRARALGLLEPYRK